MSVLFGGSIADELAETVRKQKEEFDSIDIDSYLRRNQCKNKSAEIIAKKRKEFEMEIKNNQKLQLSKSMEEDQDLDSFMEDEDEEDQDDEEQNTSNNNNHHIIKDEEDDNNVEYLDVRSQTIFTYSNKPKISKYDKKKNAKLSSLSYIQNNNVRTSYKNVDKNAKNKIIDNETYFKDDPFLDQKLIRQNFCIDRTMKNHSMIKDKSRIGKLARNNMEFIKQVLITKQPQDGEMKNNLLFNKRRFNRRLRFAMGAPNKRRQRNYSLFQHVMRKRQTDFDDKKEEFRVRGLRVQNRLNDKVLFAKHGRKKIWNAGRTKKNSKRKTGNVGSYETAKSINDW